MTRRTKKGGNAAPDPGAESHDPPAAGPSGLRANLRAAPRRFRRSMFPLGRSTHPGGRIRAVTGNLFLHIHAPRVHPWSLRPTYTFGLGVATFFLFLLLVVTGLPLMLYYTPTPEGAYASVQDLHYVVPAGRLLRNVHRWAAHLMVVTVLLHLARVFYTRAYQAPREFNWVVGVALLALTFALGFTGYCLPWDQLGYWAFTIGANMAGSGGELLEAVGLGGAAAGGSWLRRLLLGADEVGAEALLRAYVLHCVLFPLAMAVLMAVHLWRIRKDGGLARPAAASARGTAPLTSWPHAFRAELAVGMIVLAAVLGWAWFLDAPLQDPANPLVPENPAKAPWYFLGLQELVSYSAFVGGLAAPLIALAALALVPYLDREHGDAGCWPDRRERRWIYASAAICLTVVAALLYVQVRHGWLRAWFPGIPQIVVILLNPGTIWIALCGGWSMLAARRTRSTRIGAVALVTWFLVLYTVLTYFAAFHRGPDWAFMTWNG